VREGSQKFLSVVAFVAVVPFVIFNSTGGLTQTNEAGANLDVLVFNYSEASDSVTTAVARASVP